MEYRISILNDALLIKVLGPLNRKAVYTVGALIRPLVTGHSPRIILDVEGLEYEKEMVYHLGLINAFKKEIEQAGGSFTLAAGRNRITKYLRMAGLDKLFNISDTQFAPNNYTRSPRVENGKNN